MGGDSIGEPVQCGDPAPLPARRSDTTTYGLREASSRNDFPFRRRPETMASRSLGARSTRKPLRSRHS